MYKICEILCPNNVRYKEVVSTSLLSQKRDYKNVITDHVVKKYNII